MTDLEKIIAIDVHTQADVICRQPHDEIRLSIPEKYSRPRRTCKKYEKDYSSRLQQQETHGQLPGLTPAEPYRERL